MTRWLRAPLVLVLSVFAFAAVAADKPAAKGPADPAAPKAPKGKGNGKAQGKGKGTTAKKGPGLEAAALKAHGKASRHEVATGIHPVSNVEVTPFPSHADAAKKALAQNRRDSLGDAEKAARAEHQEDRWQTVLFHLREFDARSDAEACFWRVLAYYRLGELGRARTIRQLCTLGTKEEAALDTEEGMCASLQPAAALPEMLAAGEHPPDPVANPAPYAGTAPARLEH